MAIKLRILNQKPQQGPLPRDAAYDLALELPSLARNLQVLFLTIFNTLLKPTVGSTCVMDAKCLK